MDLRAERIAFAAEARMSSWYAMVLRPALECTEPCRRVRRGHRRIRAASSRPHGWVARCTVPQPVRRINGFPEAGGGTWLRSHVPSPNDNGEDAALSFRVKAPNHPEARVRRDVLPAPDTQRASPFRTDRAACRVRRGCRAGATACTVLLPCGRRGRRVARSRLWEKYGMCRNSGAMNQWEYSASTFCSGPIELVLPIPLR